MNRRDFMKQAGRTTAATGLAVSGVPGTGRKEELSEAEEFSGESAFQKWVDQLTVGYGSGTRAGLFDSTKLPFAFEYGGIPSDDLLGGWERSMRTEQVTYGERRVVRWDDPKTGLRVEWTVLLYAGFSAVEVRLSFENRGDQPSEILRKVQTLRQRVGTRQADLVYSQGGGPNASERNLESNVRRIGPEPDEFHLRADMGWSSNRHLPFWLLVTPEGKGFYYGLGWTGQWIAHWAVGSDKVIQVEAGMEYLHLRLNPGERISQPTVLLGYFTGGREGGHNSLRRILYERYAPRLNGSKVMPPVSWNGWFSLGNDINEQVMLEMVDKVAPLGLEYFCVDAGWCNVDFWDSGDWRVNRKKFPHGLEPISTAIRAKGMRMGLWFDPERVTRAAYDHFEHKEWLRPANNANLPFVWLVDLSVPEARRWMVNLIGEYARSLDLGWITWDMNYPPLGMWKQADDNNPQRQGIKEIRYVEGLYEVWDTLQKTYPDLLFQLTAGGGRRIDLESVRRSHTVWKSDFTGDGNRTRVQLSQGSQFLPGNLLNSNLIRLDSSYDYYCQFGGGLGFAHDFRDFTPERIQDASEIIRQYKDLRRYVVKDYYPLFDFFEDPQKWDGWQFYDPKDDSGFFLVFRLPDSTFPPFWAPPLDTVIKLRGVAYTKQYRLSTNVGSASKFPERATGRQLREGLSLRVSSPRKAVLVSYSAVA